jgi:hypothetical protein
MLVNNQTIMNMAKKRNFKVISEKSNVCITFAYAISYSKKYNNNSASSASVREGLEIC